jgi:integrase
MRAVDITTPDVNQYIELRIEAGASNGTINRELTTLKRAFMLGTKSTPPKVMQAPYIVKLKEDNIRKGFFEDHEFEALRDALPYHLQGFVTFAYKTGWRKSEISGLTWAQVDRKNGIVYLNPGETKNDEPRVVYLDEELKNVIESQWQARRNKKALSSFVFTAKDGILSVGDIRKAWATACKKAGIGSRLFHDFRRTAVRNMVRAGIPERVAMMISGHKTRSIFERYNIVNNDDLMGAMKKYEAYINSQRISGTGKETGKVREIGSAREAITN